MVRVALNGMDTFHIVNGTTIFVVAESVVNMNNIELPDFSRTAPWPIVGGHKDDYPASPPFIPWVAPPSTVSFNLLDDATMVARVEVLLDEYRVLSERHGCDHCKNKMSQTELNRFAYLRDLLRNIIK